MSCDHEPCDVPAAWRAYAAYNADHGENPHPLHARYPAAMWRTCAGHLGAMLARDTAPGATGQWLIVAIPAPVGSVEDQQ